MQKKRVDIKKKDKNYCFLKNKCYICIELNN